MTYRSVLANREYAAILVSQGLSTAGDQLARIAIALLVYDRTGSAFAASATYAVSYLTYLLGGPVLAAISDRNPRVTVMVACDLLRAPLVLALCLGNPPLWLVLTLLGLMGALAPPFDSARSALLPDILEGDRYITGNALMSLVLQTAQVLGFVVGGALVAATSVKGTLALDAASFIISAGMLLAFVRHRPAALAAQHRSSLLRETAAGFRLVAGHRELRHLLVYALLGSAAVIAPEGLAVPVAAGLGGGETAAGVLTASIPAGFLLGSYFILRVDADQRTRLLPLLSLLGIAPLLLTPFVDSLPLLVALWFIAGTGGTVNLVAGAAFMQTCPHEFRSRAYGVAVTSLNALQGVVLLVGGALAGPMGAQGAVGVVAAITLTTLVVFTLRNRAAVAAQGTDDLVRSSHG